jgi:glycosyltransferase involved in cell wall biosynthesis
MGGIKNNMYKENFDDKTYKVSKNLIGLEPTPLVSVIMPLYNAEKHVAEAIQSVIDQTYPCWELIIVNDGSTDNSLAVARQFESDKIKVYSQENRGASAARNYGYSFAKGEYIKFFDCDDILSTNMLEVQVARLINNKNCVASSLWGRFYNNNLNTFKLSPEDCWQDMNAIDWIQSSWRRAQPMSQPGMFLIPRQVLEKSGLWDEKLSLIDDFEFFTRVILASDGIKFSKEACLYYRSGLQNTLSGQKSRKAVESAFLSLTLGTEKLLEYDHSPLSKLCCANMWQAFVYEFYYSQQDLARKAELKVKELGGNDIEFPSGKVTKILSKIVGWKWALKIRLYFK